MNWYRKYIKTAGFGQEYSIIIAQNLRELAAFLKNPNFRYALKAYWENRDRELYTNLCNWIDIFTGKYWGIRARVVEDYDSRQLKDLERDLKAMGVVLNRFADIAPGDYSDLIRKISLTEKALIEFIGKL